MTTSTTAVPLTGADVIPLHDAVLVRLLPLGEETSASGLIVMPGTKEQDRARRGVVVQVGPGERIADGPRRGQRIDTTHELGIDVGATVLVGRYSGHAVQVEGAEHVMVRSHEILAVLEPEVRDVG